MGGKRKDRVAILREDLLIEDCLITMGASRLSWLKRAGCCPCFREGQDNVPHPENQPKSGGSSQIANNEVIAEVYNNDLLMRHIVSFVTEINDRIHIEQSSARLRFISRTAKWRFKSGGETLTLSFKARFLHL
ncbi:hypothetical protein GCK32_010696 [Trichostrongylus colubriformis]|uniref:Uncharacterized protein n=1 Tax=Trichostrongylus colubriformis TaxID=6319 RepID=A0AAN8G1J2_TRICO